ncbi:elongation factor Ts, mitochondrial [Nomia melanderi]|uniref:elongation factor Ts, mitochondrial n=1 Tax=Nomia melanderi TaxID=2448451 RepID=UPI0013045317|nr:elongation factor Ts, mitochondrial [Nomia melanderi]
MIPRQLYRSIHANYLLYTSKKTLLSKLRKKTGYTLVNCKKALELHNNDLEKAEEWLKEQAQIQGWSQAVKLQSRITSQGLIAVVTNNNHGALVEINCETDFVARNKKFLDLAETILSSVLKHGMTFKSDAPVNKTVLFTNCISALPADDGKSLGDHSALTIGSVGENINIRRALCMSVGSGLHLYGCTHPTPINPVPSSFGRYGALVAIKSDEECSTLGLQLCQHIIGMNPIKIGDPNVDEPHVDIDEESCMLYQEFLFDSSVSVQQLLQSKNTEIVDFARFEMGEVVETETPKQQLDSIETCG